MKFGSVAAAALLIAAFQTDAAPAPKGATNVVLVHGAFADGSGWADVATLLRKDGYLATVVQEPETSIAEDVAATLQILDLQSGKAVLVGHSYGGTVITEAGSQPNVAELVYVGAFQRHTRVSTGALALRMPPASTAIQKSDDGYLYLDVSQFHADFAADIPESQAELMASSARIDRRIKIQCKGPRSNLEVQAELRVRQRG